MDYLFFKNCIFIPHKMKIMRPKRVLQTLFESYVKHSVHVALSVVALSLLSAHYFAIVPSTTLLIFIFSSTLLGYNAIKFGILPKAVFQNPLARGLFYLLNGLALLLASYTFFYLSERQHLIVICTGLLVLLYGWAFPFQTTNLRNQQGVKLYWVALCWVLMAVGLPFLEKQMACSWNLLIWSLIIGLYVVVATLPFELRDMHRDPNSLQTWPQRLGIQGTKRRGYWLLLVAIVLCFCLPNVSGPMRVSALTTFGALAVLLWQSGPTKGFYFTAFWVEALPLFWWGVFRLFLYLAALN